MSITKLPVTPSRPVKFLEKPVVMWSFFIGFPILYVWGFYTLGTLRENHSHESRHVTGKAIELRHQCQPIFRAVTCQDNVPTPVVYSGQVECVVTPTDYATVIVRAAYNCEWRYR